jgi:hypothetical protein
MVKAALSPRVVSSHVGIGPIDVPLRPLCPACGAERLAIRTQMSVTFDVVASAAHANHLQVIDHRLDGCGWDEDDAAGCGVCGWEGRVHELRSGMGPRDPAWRAEHR